jgi:signal transduction histidine kinase
VRAISVFSTPQIDVLASSPIGSLMHLYIVLAQTSAVFCYAILVNQLLREELALAIEKQNKLQTFKEDLTSMIVHDLKNPLNALINSTTAFEGEKNNAFVRQTSLQMLTLVSNILDINKYEESKIPTYTSELIFEDILNSSIEQIKDLLEQKNISIKIEANLSQKINADFQLVNRVLINLMANAIKFSPNNDFITISSEKDRGYMKITIQDNGTGIPPEYHEMIFSKYGQHITKNIGITPSTGLGLTFCKMAIEAQGGKIGIESEEAKGSKFWFTLPLASVQENDIENKTQVFAVTKNEFTFTEKEKEILSPIVKTLDKIDLYELTLINNQLVKLKDYESASIKRWVNELLKSVYAGNEETYKELIRKATN